MSKLSRIVVFVTALASLFAVMSSTAGAVTWTNTGATTFHATGGPGTLSIGTASLACSGSTEEGNVPMHSSTADVGTVTVTFSPCSLVGQSTFVHCHVTLTANAYNPPVTTGALDVTCDARLTANPANSLCHISGSTPGTYTNPSGATPGRFTVSASQTLTVTNGNVPCPLGQGTGTLTEQTINITDPLGPILSSP